jgi:ABC-type lipoprotein release transport system permease subunit
MVFATVVGLALLASLLPAWRVGRDTIVAGLTDR